MAVRAHAYKLLQFALPAQPGHLYGIFPLGRLVYRHRSIPILPHTVRNASPLSQTRHTILGRQTSRSSEMSKLVSNGTRHSSLVYSKIFWTALIPRRSPRSCIARRYRPPSDCAPTILQQLYRILSAKRRPKSQNDSNHVNNRGPCQMQRCDITRDEENDTVSRTVYSKQITTRDELNNATKIELARTMTESELRSDAVKRFRIALGTSTLSAFQLIGAFQRKRYQNIPPLSVLPHKCNALASAMERDYAQINASHLMIAKSIYGCTPMNPS